MKLLVFQHVARESPAYIGEYAEENGMDLDIVELWERSYSIPSADTYSAIIILGGPMGVYEDFPSKDDELKFIAENIGKKRMLGICLGSQLIAHTLGAQVWSEPKQKEVGYYDISLTNEGQRHGLFEGFDDTFKALEWHGDVFDVPSKATLLARGAPCTHQAFAHNTAHGLLFHVEFTPERVRECLEADREWMNQHTAFNEEKFLEETERYAPLMRQQCFRLLDNFLS